MRGVDLRVGSAEVASGSSVTRRIGCRGRLAGRGHSSASVVHRVRIRRHPARDEADASRDPRHRRLRSGVARGSRTGGHPRPSIRGSSAGRRSRSCASPSSTPRCDRPSATTDRRPGRGAEASGRGVLADQRAGRGGARRVHDAAGGAADDDPLGQGPGVPGGDPDGAGPVAERAPAGRGGRQQPVRRRADAGAGAKGRDLGPPRRLHRPRPAVEQGGGLDRRGQRPGGREA